MHPELFSLVLFFFVAAFTPGPNNILASYSGFNFGILKTIPHMFGVIFGFTTLVAVMNPADIGRRLATLLVRSVITTYIR